MTIKITYFAHGTTTDNNRQISSGWCDVELSDLGIKQSIGLSDQARDKTFDVVFCSDLSRSEQSAKLAFGGITPIVSDARLRECNYGKFNGGSSSIVGPMQVNAVKVPFPDGESYEDVRARMGDFLDFLKMSYDGKKVALVAHQATQLSLDVLLRGRTWEEAFAEDWRTNHAWKPGWDYVLD